MDYITLLQEATIAQLGEHKTEDLRVAGSIPACSIFLEIKKLIRQSQTKFCTKIKHFSLVKFLSIL